MTQFRPMGCEWGEMLGKIFVFLRRELQNTLFSPGLDIVMGGVLQFCPHMDSLRMKPTSGGNHGEVGQNPWIKPVLKPTYLWTSKSMSQERLLSHVDLSLLLFITPPSSPLRHHCL